MMRSWQEHGSWMIDDLDLKGDITVEDGFMSIKEVRVHLIYLREIYGSEEIGVALEG